ncbi:MAG TPA: Rieske 2Fe-2S domain-containing protein [Acidimicrobiia bacterium]|nr:Rieske 2Fe-2S domain-containing protein [Acidimicrobiia bacterium]
MKGWPHTTHPTGWYQVTWSFDLKPGEVRPIRLFGEELVLYRTEGGVANVFDAYCPHLGAHLGHGGSVKGERLQCAWHGYQYDCAGDNVCIPFTDRLNRSIHLRRWFVEERNHLVMVWYDALGRDPWWHIPEIPEFYDRPGYYQPDEYGPAAHSYGILRVKPQLPVENAADPMHFAFVHGAAEPSTHELFETDGHYMHFVMKMLFGGGHERTWMTPDGPVYGMIEGEQWGLGIGVARFEIAGMGTAQIVATTPVDDDHCLAFSTIASSRDPEHPDELTGRSVMMIDAQVGQVKQDFHIWSNQSYLTKPSFLMPEERNYAALRRWFEQFYPDEQAAEAASAAGEDGQ